MRVFTTIFVRMKNMPCIFFFFKYIFLLDKSCVLIRWRYFQPTGTCPTILQAAVALDKIINNVIYYWVTFREVYHGFCTVLKKCTPILYKVNLKKKSTLYKIIIALSWFKHIILNWDLYNNVYIVQIPKLLNSVQSL